ncbi:hypothetical protein, partial [uncultured Bosea sp.]|uniref:hypothetical protein n=1 Tax=uncultured Bosea sp. TaxID=211457 RepID=UPI0025CC5838
SSSREAQPAPDTKVQTLPRFGDFTLGAAARLNQTNGLRLEFLPQPALPLAHEMLLLPSEELSSLLGQVQSLRS